MEEVIKVGMADMNTCEPPKKITTLGLGSCVGIVLYDEKTTAEFAKKMMEKGVYVVAFSYPVVPKGKARIRTQVCASHTKEDIDFIVKCFKEVREKMQL